MVKVPAKAGIIGISISRKTSEKRHLRRDRYRELSEGQVPVKVVWCGVEFRDTPVDGDCPGRGVSGGVVRGVGRVRAADRGASPGLGDL